MVGFKGGPQLGPHYATNDRNCSAAVFEKLKTTFLGILGEPDWKKYNESLASLGIMGS